MTSQQGSSPKSGSSPPALGDLEEPMMASEKQDDGGNMMTDAGGKYVRYTNEQVDALERVYNECPKPSSVRRQQLIKECPILSNIEAKQIKVWFQNRRCRERQRMESNRLQSMNAKLQALNKLLVDENEQNTKKIAQLSLENQLLKEQLAKMRAVDKKGDHLNGLAIPQRKIDSFSIGGNLLLPNGNSPRPLHNLHDEISSQPRINLGLPFGLQIDGQGAVPASLDNSQESAVTGTNSMQAAGDGDQSTSALLVIAEEILADFLAKATGTAVDFVEMPGMKGGADFIGRVSISYNATGVAARAAGLVQLEPAKVAELLKDRMQWLRDCRRCDVLGGFRTANGGSVELIYTQMYAPTTLAAPRDFCTLRYTKPLDDGGIVTCERSLIGAHGGAAMPAVPAFVRAEMLPSGYLIRPYESGGCVIIAVDHMDLEPWNVTEVLRPLYKSSAVLAQGITIRALRYLRRVAQEAKGDTPDGPGNLQQMAAWRAIAERIAMGFNEAVNGFADDGWAAMPSDGIDDVSVTARPTLPGKASGLTGDGLAPLGGGVLCAKASMLLQSVPPAMLIRYLRENRSEWADGDIDADSAAAVRASMATLLGNGNSATQTPLPLAYAVDQEEFLELVKLDPHGQSQQSPIMPRESFLLQLCSGVDDTSPAALAQLVFAPVDATSTADSVPLLPSGFRVIPLDLPPPEETKLSRTLDLASSLESQSEGARRTCGAAHERSVLTIAFQFVFEAQTRDSVAAMARHYVRSVVASVQRAAIALAPPRIIGSSPSPSTPAAREPPKSIEALTLARRILHCYRVHTNMDLGRSDGSQGDVPLKIFWDHPEAIICVVLKKSMPRLLFANQAGLDMLETTSNGLAEVDWEKTYDDEGCKTAYASFSQAMQQGYAVLPPGVRISCKGRAAAYERAIAWQVVDDDENLQCIAFTHVHWSFLS